MKGRKIENSASGEIHCFVTEAVLTRDQNENVSILLSFEACLKKKMEREMHAAD